MMELDWDPEVESPATIAVIGGGPVGIEAAIYGRFLGYYVSIFEERRVAHRMLDWHDRPLAVPVSQCTTSLGHATITAQNPEYKRRSPDDFYTGRTYAEEYLLPLAKCDLLFDDIHFLSPVSDVSRLQTWKEDDVEMQERCNDEFRIVVDGRHRGTWISRADVVFDCRGMSQHSSGMGPGGGKAIGETGLRDKFLKHTPLDRKFEAKSIVGKKTCLVGQSKRAIQFAIEFVNQFADKPDTQLIWMIRSTRKHDTLEFTRALKEITERQSHNVVILETLGVDSISQQADGPFVLRLLRDDDSTMEITADGVVALTDGRANKLSTELYEDPFLDVETPSFFTQEPGFYVLRGGSVEAGAGVGLVDAFENIRRLFSVIAGREDLDLYKIMEQQATKDRSIR